MVWAPWTPITWSLLFELQNTNTSTLQIERSSVGGASRNGARLPGLEPGRAQKKKSSSPAVTGFGGIFFAAGSQCRFLLMKYGGDRHIPRSRFLLIHLH